MGKEELRLLVVEDEAEVGRMVFRCLRRQWRSVKVVSSAEDGIRELETGGYDVVLSDLDCPCEDGGLRVAEMSSVPVLIHTARTSADVHGLPVVYKPTDMKMVSDELFRVWESHHRIKA